MPPGETLVLLSKTKDAIFGWWRPHPRSGITALNGRDGWTCTIFRNESHRLSSDMILAAERMLFLWATSFGPDGLLTYVWDKKIESSNPGYCFKKAGYKLIGRSADNRKSLLQKIP